MHPWITQLTPLSFLERSAEVFPDSPAIDYKDTVWTFAELKEATEKRARMFLDLGIQPGDRVAYMLPNVPEMLAAHYAVPLIDGVLVAINTRLAQEEVRYILDHSGAKALIIDAEFLPTIADIADELETVTTIGVVTDPHAERPANGPAGSPAGTSVAQVGTPFEDLLAASEATTEPAALDWSVDDENRHICLNYTSGTTGKPKGVLYTHRGSYLNALNQITHLGLNHSSRYLWTLPMFHCNGWTNPWALVAAGSLQVGLRAVRSDEVWRLIEHHRLTHLCAAPTVIRTITHAPEAHQLTHPLTITSAAAPLSPTTLSEVEELGFTVLHVYGLTETYGPYTVCEPQTEWAQLPTPHRARFQARQGVAQVLSDPIRVVEASPDVDGSLVDVPRDGVTVGEIVMRGNTVMTGYFRDQEATDKAFAGGWFHSGDLAVWHEDGYVEIRDRAKDVVISGGENISTIEVEHAVGSHPAVSEVAVIGIPDKDWGERPAAFVVLRPGQSAQPQEIIEHVRTHIARYKVPKVVEVVDELPKTSTGKIQKFQLRNTAWQGHESSVQG